MSETMKLKVCMLYHHPHHILQKDARVLKEARSLMNSGHDVSIVYGGRGDILHNEVNSYGTYIPCIAAWKRSKNPFFQAFCIFISYIITIISKLKINIVQVSFVHIANAYEYNADIYHCHDIPTLLSGYLLKKLTKSKLVYDSHELSIDSGYVSELSYLSKYIVKRLERFLARRADGVITVNDSIGDIMSCRMNIPKPIIIKNFPPFINIDENPNILQKHLHIPDDSIIILYTGGLWKERGMLELIETARRLPRIHFVVIGKIYPGPHVYSLPNFHQIDPVPPNELIIWASSASIGIHPIQNVSLNYYYSLGNKIGEYIMAGLPMAVSDFPEMRKLAVDEDLGIVFNPEDPKDIARAIKELLEPETYARKKKNVMEARKKYCWEREEKKLNMIYDKLVIK